MDVEVLKDTELMVAHVEGLTLAGMRFVEKWVELEMVVLDTNRIIIPLGSLPGMLDAIERAELVGGIHDLTVRA